MNKFAESGLKNSNDKAENNSNNTEDLMLAIKQVAKEMAEAVKLSQKQVIKEAIKDAVKTVSDSMYKPNNTVNETKSSKSSKSSCSEPQGEVMHIVRGGNKKYMNTSFNDSEIKNVSLYQREVEFHNNLQNRLELQRKKKVADEMKTFKSKPDICKTSKKIIEEKFPDKKPIYEHTIDEIYNHKSEVIEKLMQTLRIEEDNKKTWRHDFPEMMDKTAVDTFIDTQYQWLNTKNQKIEYERNRKKRETEVFENSTLLNKPKINPKTNVLAKNKNNNEPVYKRLYNDYEANLEMKELLQLKNVPTFTPVINKKKPKFANNLSLKNKKDSNSEHISSNSHLKNNFSKSFNNSSFTKSSRVENDGSFESSKAEDMDLDNVGFKYDDYFGINTEDPLISKYRLTVEMNQLSTSPVKDMLKRKSNLLKEIKDQVNKKLLDDIKNVKNEGNKSKISNIKSTKLNRFNTISIPNNNPQKILTKFEEPANNVLYKLNVSDNTTAWLNNNQPVNKVVGSLDTPKFSQKRKK